MKIRQGFVSNSSSSSFIVKSEDKSDAESKGLRLFKVSDMIKNLKPFYEVVKSVEDDACYDDENFPNFIALNLSYIDVPYYEELVKLENRIPGCYISSEFDRDVAYSENFSYETFETDL